MASETQVSDVASRLSRPLSEEDALTEAVTQVICETLRIPRGIHGAEITLGPYAFPGSGDWFYAVYSDGERINSQVLPQLGIQFSVSIALIGRLNARPPEKTGVYYLKHEFNPRVQEVRNLLHANYQVISRAMTIIGGRKYYRPLYWSSTSPAREIDGSTWNSEPESRSGIMRVLSFGGAEI